MRNHYRRNFTVLAGLIGLVAGCGGEPRHHRKTLSDWLTVYQNAQPGSPAELEAQTEVRAIGTNALPYLSEWAISTDPTRANQARQGFIILGATAAPAIPALAKLLTSTNDLEALSASLALANIGAPAVPSLLAILTNNDYKISLNAFLALPELGTNAQPAIPFLVQELKHENHFHRERAASALAGLHIEPAIVIPALTQSLNDRSPAVRFHAISGLSEFGSDARPAAASIKAIMEHDQNLQKVAKTALLQIAPDLVSNAPPR